MKKLIALLAIAVLAIISSTTVFAQEEQFVTKEVSKEQGTRLFETYKNMISSAVKITGTDYNYLIDSYNPQNNNNKDCEGYTRYIHVEPINAKANGIPVENYIAKSPEEKISYVSYYWLKKDGIKIEYVLNNSQKNSTNGVPEIVQFSLELKDGKYIAKIRYIAFQKTPEKVLTTMLNKILNA